MLVQEVILENFMSYEYARIRLRPGVNVVCGPNGSGKSSLLLAISVAMGQSYTERSKRLSDLIRWGNDQARVTLVIDNRRTGGRRRVPRYNKDELFLTRVLRRDGNYWFELENRAATKAEVARFLAKLGIEPDNMLIIMHQNMVEQFTILSPQEKLRMVEAAVGLESYRQNILTARRKLSRLSSQESSTNRLLESAEQTLNYWREQYDRYQEKKQLLTKRRFLERELAWAEVLRREKAAQEFENQIRRQQNATIQIQKENGQVSDHLSSLRSSIGRLKIEWNYVFQDRLSLERESAGQHSTKSLCDRLLKETATLEELIQRGNPIPLTIQEKISSSSFTLLNSENLRALVRNAGEQLAKSSEGIEDNKKRMLTLEENIERMTNQILESEIKMALLKHHLESIEAELERLKEELLETQTYINKAFRAAEEVGPRIAVVRSLSEVLDETRTTDGHLAALSDVSEDVERMYESYSKLYFELKNKAQLVSENRDKALEETITRTQAWQRVVKDLLSRVSLQYQRILSQAQALGEVGLEDGHDIESAGLAILVGFKGGKPVPLNAYTQSGGERTTATVSFLLALQQHVRSPFRAVDEYDIHMDPKNRELIARMLISTVRSADEQYVVLTPSQISFTDEEVNIVTVQSVGGKSVVKEVVGRS